MSNPEATPLQPTNKQPTPRLSKIASSLFLSTTSKTVTTIGAVAALSLPFFLEMNTKLDNTCFAISAALLLVRIGQWMKSARSNSEEDIDTLVTSPIPV